MNQFHERYVYLHVWDIVGEDFTSPNMQTVSINSDLSQTFSVSV